MDFVAHTILATDLARLLVTVHCGGRGQQPQARQALDVAFHVVRVEHFHAHHLVAATDAQHCRPLAMGPDDGLGTAVAPQFIQVMQGGFGARQDDDVGLLDILSIVGVKQVHARVSLQCVKVGVIGKMAKHDHGHVDLAALGLHRLLSQRHTVFLLNIDVFVVRNYAQHGDAADVLQHLAPLVKQAHVATELVDDDALDETAVFGSLQGDAAIDRGKHPTPVDITHEDHVGLGMPCHGQVHQVGVTQVDFRDAARALHHDGVETGCQTVKGSAHLTPVIDVGRAATPVIIGILVADGLAVQDDLRRVVTLGLEQQRIHVGMARDAGSLGLDSLGATDFKALGRGVGVECHILGLERCGAVAVLLKDTAKGGSHDTLAHVAARSGKHHWMQSLVIHSFSLAKTNR